MSPDLERRLKAAHPELLRCLREKGSRAMIGDFGIACGGGWFSIIDELRSALELTVVAGGPQPIAAQITQEAGRLRFNVVGVPAISQPDVDALITAAQEQSATACEVCGAPAVLRWQRGVQTVCDLHASPGARVVQDGDFERIRAEREVRRQNRVT